MSRVSLSKRLGAIRASMREHDPLTYALHNLPPKLRRWYDDWRRECDAITARLGRNSYEAMLEGEGITPPMPPLVADALGIDPYLNAITTDMSLDEIQDRWNIMLSEGRKR